MHHHLSTETAQGAGIRLIRGVDKEAIAHRVRDLKPALDAGREASSNLARLIRDHSLESRQERQEAERGG
jgi:hypothetical protein